MDSKKIDVKKIVRGYIKNFPKNIRVTEVLLFGSYATGNIHKDSDIDLVVISPDFRKMNFIKRLETLSRLREGASENVAMDIIGYTPREFKAVEKESLVMKQAKKEGKVVYKAR